MMPKSIQLTKAEEKLAALIWEHAPLSSPELVALAEREMDWKKSTTYTILKKLFGKGICKNENALVSVLLTRDEHLARHCHHYVEDRFGGSLPKFITSFFSGKKLTAEQSQSLKRLIEAHEEDSTDG